MCVGAFSVQLCKLNVGFGDFSPAILWIVTQFDFCYISLVLYLSDLSRQGRKPCAVALELKVSSGGGGGGLFAFCHWLLFKLQSPFFHDCPEVFLRELCSLYNHSFTHEGMETWRFCLLQTTAGQYLTCCALSLCVFCRVHSCAFAFCPLRCPAGLNCLCSVPPTANWEVKCLCMPSCVLICSVACFSL